VSSLKEQTNDFRVNMLTAVDVYLAARKEFAAFEGKMVDDSNFKQINDSITKVQDTFADLWHMLKFIDLYADFAKNSLKTYREFIDTLKQAGAKEVEPKETNLH
jgi:flagellin-specific chaperone FliS